MEIYLPTPQDGACHDCSSDPCHGGETICDVQASADGGREGFLRRYPSPSFAAESGSLIVFFDARRVPDRIVLRGSQGDLYDSGLVGEFTGGPASVRATVAVPAGTEWIEVQVYPDQDESWSTVWNFEITCANTPP